MNEHKHCSKEEPSEHSRIASLLSGFETSRDYLIPALQLIQNTFGYLSDESMRMVAGFFGISPGEVLGVATFYNQFRFHPPGRHHVKVCMGTACHVVGGDIILENFERRLGIKVGETTPDREYSLESVACVGCCALAPVAVVDGKTHGRVAPSRVEGIMLGFQMEGEDDQRDRTPDGDDE